MVLLIILFLHFVILLVRTLEAQFTYDDFRPCHVGPRILDGQ